MSNKIKVNGSDIKELDPYDVVIFYTGGIEYRVSLYPVGSTSGIKIVKVDNVGVNDGVIVSTDSPNSIIVT